MSDFNAAAQVVALVTGLRMGLEVGEIVRMIDDAAREGAGSDQEVINRLETLASWFAAATAYVCQEWERADDTGRAAGYMAALGRVAAEHPV